MTAAEVTRRALGAVGKGASESGWCERFTRGLFGFPAKYATARLAYLASRDDGPIHTDTNPPPGVPVYFDITAGPNRDADHVAVSVGDGYVVSTSVGPGKTVARVKITDFGRTIWPGAIRYTGWAEFYHGHRVHTPPKGSAPAPPPPTGKDTLVVSKSDLEDISYAVWSYQNQKVTDRSAYSHLLYGPDELAAKIAYAVWSYQNEKVTDRSAYSYQVYGNADMVKSAVLAAIKQLPAGATAEDIAERVAQITQEQVVAASVAEISDRLDGEEG